MFDRIIDDVKESAASTVRRTSLAAMAAFALFVAVSFLCAAVFVWVLQTYGLIEACLAGAGMFLVVALIAATSSMAGKRRNRRREERRPKSAPNPLADPMLLATGLQVVRAIGVKRLIPILALGGLALGFLASRDSAAPDQTPAE